jgi:hypothetical protein
MYVCTCAPTSHSMFVGSTQPLTEYQEYFLEGKGGRCLVQTTLPLYVPIVLKTKNLNLLEPSGLVKACRGVNNCAPVYVFIYVRSCLYTYVPSYCNAFIPPLFFLVFSSFSLLSLSLSSSP